MSVIHTPRKPELDLRTLSFPAVMVGMLGALFLRLWYFQVVKAPELVERAEATRVDKLFRSAPRGLIYDRNGELLAGLKPQIVITGRYDILSKRPDVVATLATMLKVDPDKIKSKLSNARRSPGLQMPIFIGAPPEVGTQIAEEEGDLPGVGVDLAPMRVYPDTRNFTHVLGYVRQPSRQDLKRIKQELENSDAPIKEPAEFVGASGLERHYETDLMGVAGDEVAEIDAKRRPLRVVARDNPISGKELVLSLDAKLQRQANQLMGDHHYIGAVVALEPGTGEVLCLASTPTYDQSVFEGGISKDAWEHLSKDPEKPLMKRAIQSSYSPGSTFKIVTSLAAYEKGVFDPNRPAYCDGYFQLGSARWKCLGHHGSITYRMALVKSCNTYFADLGHRAGGEALTKAAAEVGLGESTGIDLGGEDLGLVPSERYLVKNFKNRHWHAGDTINFSIGQGYVRATPLQMCDVAALVANNGTSYRPHLVRAIRSGPSPSETRSVTPTVLRHVDASPTFWSTVKDALQGVVEEGTARVARIPGLTWAGKTGSTEHGKGKLTHSWFVGFAPVDHPKIAVCVLVEEGGHGADAAAPIARDIVKSYLSARTAKKTPRG